MVVLGVGEMIGGFLVTKVIELRDMRMGVVCCIFLTILGFVVFIVLNEIRIFGWLCFLFTFLWGVQDSALNTVMNSILGFEFESNIIPFSVFKFSQSLFIFIFNVLASLIVGQARFRIWIICSFVFAMVAYTVTISFKFKEKSK